MITITKIEYLDLELITDDSDFFVWSGAPPSLTYPKSIYLFT